MKKNNPTIIGAIAGDIIGSVFEFNNCRSLDFPLFSTQSDYTDDSVLTIAIADCLLHHKNFKDTLWAYGRAYPGRGYGTRFFTWLLNKDPEPYNSFGNGSAMRVSPVGFAYDTLHDVLDVAKKTAEVSHNHPEGIKGAQATAAAIFLAKKGYSKQDISEFITTSFSYNLHFTTDEIRPVYHFNETCQQTVPQAIVCFLESTSYEHAIRLAISIGGDSDTIACITGGIAAAFYKEIPENILTQIHQILPQEFNVIIEEFDIQFGE